MFKKASKSACISTVVVCADSSSPTSTSAKTTAGNTEENPSDPEPAHKTDIQMEYSSDKLYSLSTGAETKNYLYEFMSVQLPSDNMEYSII